ncbi:hypothetical protein GCM10010515_77130 [Streptomyces fructofermentans]|uniref:Uncharacterized protein n=1 Tax=Streptomyces fructofermentans TaxID=152141 RepID=A0A918NWB5_9ACTN|nr:hypothetical protein GCM10010515_77130 [Streptomyces fructofermentans]
MVAVDGGEEAVEAGPLAGDGVVVVAVGFPAGEHDFGDAGAVDEFFGDGGGEWGGGAGWGGASWGSGGAVRVPGGG